MELRAMPSLKLKHRIIKCLLKSDKKKETLKFVSQIHNALKADILKYHAFTETTHQSLEHIQMFNISKCCND